MNAIMPRAEIVHRLKVLQKRRQFGEAVCGLTKVAEMAGLDRSTVFAAATGSHRLAETSQIRLSRALQRLDEQPVPSRALHLTLS